MQDNTSQPRISTLAGDAFQGGGAPAKGKERGPGFKLGAVSRPTVPVDQSPLAWAVWVRGPVLLVHCRRAVELVHELLGDLWAVVEHLLEQVRVHA